MTELVSLFRENVVTALEAAGLEVPEVFRLGTIVWLDGEPERNAVVANFQSTKAKLRRFIRTFESFTDPDQCYEYIVSLPLSENVLVILTPPISVELLSNLKNLLQVNIIDIFSTRTDDTDYSFALDHYNVTAIVKDIAPIVNQLKERRYLPCVHDPIRFNFLSDTVTHSKSRNTQDGTFMYVKLFRNVVSHMDFVADDMKDMIVFLRQKCAQNRYDLAFVDIIEHEYHSRSPIWFYTQPKFLYGILNKSLYNYDIESMYSMRIFIRDLHNQIDEMFNRNYDVRKITVGNQRFQLAGNILATTLILYRGQRMLKEELEKLKLNEGNLLSINNFFSTSTDENVALMFSGDAPLQDSKECAVVFKIEAKVEYGFWNAPFINIDSISSLGSNEQEYLFTIGSIFRIEQTQCHTDGYWQVNLTLTDEHDPQLLGAMGSILQASGSGKQSLASMGAVLLMMGAYDLAEKVLHQALANHKDLIELCYTHIYLGKVYAQTGAKNDYLYHHQMALKIYEEQQPIDPEQVCLAGILINLGRTYEVLNELSLAQHCIEKSVELEVARQEVNFASVLMAHFAIRHILKKQCKFDEALAQGQLALDIAIAISPPISNQMVDTEHLSMTSFDV